MPCSRKVSFVGFTASALLAITLVMVAFVMALLESINNAGLSIIVVLPLLGGAVVAASVSMIFYLTQGCFDEAK
jgi:hypothetical protein